MGGLFVRRRPASTRLRYRAVCHLLTGRTPAEGMLAAVRSPATTDTLADRFTRYCAAVVARLPWGLDNLVPPTLLGFALINGTTFGFDLVLLTLFHGWWGWPVWLSVTLGYLCAFAVSFVLNRTFTFHSHAPVGRQAAIYVVVLTVNYLAFILGVGAGLVALGLEYHVARLLAGTCEAVYMYSAMRWVVFRGAGESAPQPESPRGVLRRR